MSDNPRGTFTPVHGVLPNPSEPDWDEPTDLGVGGNEQLSIDALPEQGGIPAVDQLTSALQTIKDVLDQKIESLNKRGSELFRDSNYAEAQKKAEQGKTLAHFKSKAEDLHKDWLFLRKEIFLDDEVKDSETQNGMRKRKAPQKLIVKFENEDRFFESSAAETFSRAIARIGVKRVEGLGLKRLNHPLVSLSPPDKYQSNFVDGHYIVTHFSTEDKRRLLLEIGERLGVSIQADLVD
jgi:hypothetical protein